MYCEYWNLYKPPFDNVPDSSMYVDCHESMEDVISETIFAIKEGNDCFAVIVGDVGLGKTLSLRIIIDSLEPEKYKVALITNPALSFIQLLREIIGQITGKQCGETKKVDLLEIFNRLLFEANDQGKKIVIVIDESNVLSSGNLDDLRLLTNMQDDEHNLFTLILAGQMELAQKLENPKRANLFQRIGTYCHIQKLPSEAAVKTYIESRLRLAGTQEKVFADDAIPVIWEFSEHGVPRLINKICKLCLKAGETNEFKIITGEIASQIADRFQKLSKITSHKRKSQSSPEIEPPKELATEEPEVKESKKKTRSSTAKKATPKAKTSATPVSSQPEITRDEKKAVLAESVTLTPVYSPPETAIEDIKAIAGEQIPTPVLPPPEIIPVEKIVVSAIEIPSISMSPQSETVNTEIKAVAPEQISTPVPPQPEIIPVEKRAIPQLRESSTDISYQQETKNAESTVVPLARTSSTYVPLPQEAKAVEIERTHTEEITSSPEEKEEQPDAVEQEAYEEVIISKQKVKMSIPENIIRQAKQANSESKNKLAGYWSAQVIKDNPHVMHSPLIDPVSIWFEIKSVILSKFNGTNSALK
jgi:general secretion pathway protein A